MKKSAKVSIIVPNYNSGKYIKKCLQSIIIQTYKNIEIIVVDDGSTDNSIEVIKECCFINKDIILVCQENMNASIARNKGLEISTGDYLLFLDSDDILENNAVMRMVNAMEVENVDLVIAGHQIVNENGEHIKTCKICDDKKIIKDTMQVCHYNPVPTNKLYKRSLLVSYKVIWGNVRIGQDLNFYLKYLAIAEKICVIPDIVYKWRIVSSSIGHTVSFRIFDIYESFNDVKKFYKRNGYNNLYNDYIAMIEYRHYYQQMEKQKWFSSKEERMLVVKYFSILINKIDITTCKNYSMFKNEVRNCRIKLLLKYIYTSALYNKIDGMYKFFDFTWREKWKSIK